MDLSIEDVYLPSQITVGESIGRASKRDNDSLTDNIAGVGVVNLGQPGFGAIRVGINDYTIAVMSGYFPGTQPADGDVDPSAEPPATGFFCSINGNMPDIGPAGEYNWDVKAGVPSSQTLSIDTFQWDKVTDTAPNLEPVTLNTPVSKTKFAVGAAGIGAALGLGTLYAKRNPEKVQGIVSKSADAIGSGNKAKGSQTQR
jgi:hypothetical protein